MPHFFPEVGEKVSWKDRGWKAKSVFWSGLHTVTDVLATAEKNLIEINS